MNCGGVQDEPGMRSLPLEQGIIAEKEKRIEQKRGRLKFPLFVLD